MIGIRVHPFTLHVVYHPNIHTNKHIEHFEVNEGSLFEGAFQLAISTAEGI